MTFKKTRGWLILPEQDENEGDEPLWRKRRCEAGRAAAVEGHARPEKPEPGVTWSQRKIRIGLVAQGVSPQGL